MESYVLPIFFSLNLMLVATHAAIPPELYWKRMLPRTSMPKAITELLISRGGVSTGHMEKPAYDDQNAHIVKWGQSADTKTQFANLINKWTHAAMETKSEGLAPPLFWNWLLAAEETEAQNQIPFLYGDKETQSQDQIPFLYGAKETQSQDQIPFLYGTKETQLQNQIPFLYGGKKTQSHDHRSAADLFFLEEDLRPGTKKSLHFSKNKYAAPLLPRQITEPIPFSSDKMKEILNKFSVEPKSMNARIIEKAIAFCEAATFEGEEKYCATSLESLVDFITSKLGKNVHAISTEVDNEMKLQNFSLKHVKKLADDKVIACHRMTYPYAVFLCHKLLMTSAYYVPLEGEDGVRVNSVAVCHRDTSKWNPKHMAFKVLKVKPGTAPVCHFSPEDTVVWFPK